MKCHLRSMRDIRIYYETEGEGYPFVLYTGAGGDGQMWRLAGYLEQLAGLRCILMDHRGHGRSDRPEGIEAHRMQNYAEDVSAVLDAEGIEQAVFWGYSDGAGVGFEFARRNPERVSKLISLGAPGLWDADYLQECAELAEAVRTNGSGWLIDQIEEAENISLPRDLARNMRETNVEMLALELEAWRSWKGIWQEMEMVETETLFLAGDRGDPDGLIQRAAEKMPNGYAVELKGKGHLEAYLDAVEVGEKAYDFLAGLL